MTCSGNSSHLQLSSRVLHVPKSNVYINITASGSQQAHSAPHHQHHQPSQLSRFMRGRRVHVAYICALWHATSVCCLLFYALSLFFFQTFFTNFCFAAVFRSLCLSTFWFFFGGGGGSVRFHNTRSVYVDCKILQNEKQAVIFKEIGCKCLKCNKSKKKI